MNRRFPKDLRGMSFGRLTVLKLQEIQTSTRGNKYQRWLCKCSCGNTKVINRSNLINEDSKSCGCYQKEVVSVHNLSRHRLYNIWIDIRKRCFDKNRKAYKNYGGRGITICDEWKDFMNFYHWSLGNGYNEKLSLDRINNDGDYAPENCRWTTRLVQNNNTRRNVYVEFDGEKMTLSQLARKFGLSPGTIKYRLKHGYKGEDLVAKANTVRRKRRKIS